jgi:hypothetical protein
MAIIYFKPIFSFLKIHNLGEPSDDGEYSKVKK